MIIATFIFNQVARDERFDRLNAEIAGAAEANPGYLGREIWSNEAGETAAVYYWRSRPDLEAFSRDPVHLEAKAAYREWYGGYRVVISEVLDRYGDGRLNAPHERGERGP